ncbi:MAG: hypothetical protein U0R28_00005, partial [Candidatus Nanopelagicales bacterium]
PVTCQTSSVDPVPECDVYEPDSTPGSALRGTSKAPAGEQEGDEAEERHIAQVFRIALKPGCQGTLVSARWRTGSLPGGGHEFCPVMAMGSARWGHHGRVG